MGKLSVAVARAHSQMAKKPRQHKTDDRAHAVFRDIMADVAVVNSLASDYGIDFHVQMLDKDKASPSVCLVQLKGHEASSVTTKGDKQFVKQRLASERLIDYFERREPVFLVVVEVSSRKARYVFLQQYVEEGLLPKKWRSQKNVTIFVPEENDLRNEDVFRGCLNRAWEFMEDKYPGSVEAAVKKELERLEQRDPRVGVRIDVKDGKVGRHFTLKDGCEISVTAIGQGAVDRMTYAIRTGLPVEFSEQEIRFAGSPLLEANHPGGPVKVQFGTTREILASLLRLDTENHVIARIDGFHGKIIAGQEQYHLDAELYDGLMSLRASHLASASPVASLSQSFDCRKWDGKPVRRLPHFESILSVFDGGPEGLQLDIIPIDSGQVATTHLDYRSCEPLGQLTATLEIISKERRIAEIIHQNPRFKASLTKEHIEDVHRVHQILTEGKSVKSAVGHMLTLTVRPDDARNILNMDMIRDVVLSPMGEQIDFFAEPIVLGTSTMCFDLLTIEDVAEVSRQLKDPNNEWVRVSLTGAPESTVTETIDLEACWRQQGEDS